MTTSVPETNLITPVNARDNIGWAVRLPGQELVHVLLGLDRDGQAVVAPLDTLIQTDPANQLPRVMPRAVEFTGMQRASFYTTQMVLPSVCSVLAQQYNTLQSLQKSHLASLNKIDAIVARAHYEAKERDWCSEFNDIMRDLDLPLITRHYDVETVFTIEVRANVRVEAGDADEAESLVDDGEYDREQAIEAIEEAIRNRGIATTDIDNADARAAVSVDD